MGPIAQTITRLYGTRGWIGIGVAALVLFVLVPVLNLAVPDVITSYSIHYTKLYEGVSAVARESIRRIGKSAVKNRLWPLMQE